MKNAMNKYPSVLINYCDFVAPLTVSRSHTVQYIPIHTKIENHWQFECPSIIWVSCSVSVCLFSISPHLHSYNQIKCRNSLCKIISRSLSPIQSCWCAAVTNACCVRVNMHAHLASVLSCVSYTPSRMKGTFETSSMCSMNSEYTEKLQLRVPFDDIATLCGFDAYRPPASIVHKRQFHKLATAIMTNWRHIDLCIFVFFLYVSTFLIRDISAVVLDWKPDIV